MIKRFESNVDAMVFLSKLPENDLKNYRIGTDKAGNIIAEKNTWFNSSWLGRAINRRKGDQLDDSGFFNATRIIMSFAKLKISPNSGDKRMEWIQNAKKLQEPLLAVASNVFAKDGVKMHQLMENLKPESAKKNEVELSEAQKIEDEKLTDVQKEIKSILLDRWSEEESKLIKQLIKLKIPLWKEILGGKDHREVKQRHVDKSGAYDEHKWGFDFSNDFQDKRGVDFFKGLEDVEENSLKQYSGKFKEIYKTIEDWRDRASNREELSDEQTKCIQKFYSIRDNFFFGENDKKAIDGIKNVYLIAVNHIVEQNRDTHSFPNLEDIKINIDTNIDQSMPILEKLMEDLSKELTTLEESIKKVPPPKKDWSFL